MASCDFMISFTASAEEITTTGRSPSLRDMTGAVLVGEAAEVRVRRSDVELVQNSDERQPPWPRWMEFGGMFIFLCLEVEDDHYWEKEKQEKKHHDLG